MVGAYGDLSVAVAAVSDSMKYRMDKAMSSLKSGMITMGEVIGKYVIPPT